jgi:hypothetical protein
MGSTVIRTARSMCRASGLLFILSGPLTAQTTLVGSIRDSAGHPIAGAQISVDALGRRTTADDSGHYLLSGLSPGLRLVHVRRVGYTPVGKMVRLVDGENRLTDLTLDRVVVELDTVTTKAKSHDVEMIEFEEHRKIGLGHFVTRASLDSFRGRPIFEAFAQMNGLQFVRGYASQLWIASSRGRKSLNQKCATLEDKTAEDKAKFSVIECALCFPRVYLDMMLLSRPEVGDRYSVPNLNTFSPDQLEGIEVFTGASQTPVRWAGLGSQCGVIVLHTRRP